MQYILSEEEYNELVTRADKAVEDQTDTINNLCVQVTNLTLKDYGYGGEANLMPHGRIHNTYLIQDKLDDSGLEHESREWNLLEEKLEEGHPTQEHCDDCPCTKVMPTTKVLQ